MRAAAYIPDPSLLEEVRLMLHAENPSMSDADAEDFASEAYATLLAKARSGAKLKSPAGLIRTIARADVIDSRRSSRSQVHKAMPLAPESSAFHGLADDGPELLSEIERASTSARLNAIVSTLTRRQQAIFKCRFALGMSAAEAAAACRLGRSTVKREWNAALEAAMEALAGFEGEAFSRAQLKAVHAYVFRFGELSEDDPQRRLVEDDPTTYQLMLETRASMRAQAGEVDLRGALAGLGLLGGGISLAALGAFLRGKLAGAGASQGSGAAASGGGSGLLAAGAGGKLAAGCAVLVCAGGGAVAIKASRDPGRPSGATGRAAAERQVEGPPAPVPVSLTSQIDPNPQPASDGTARGGGHGHGGGQGHHETGGKPGHPDESPSSGGAGADADAEAAGDEFDPLAAPSAAPVTPAPSPASGSSSSSSGGSSSGAGTSVGGAEFGP